MFKVVDVGMNTYCNRNCHRRTHYRLTPREYQHLIFFLEARIIGLHFAAENMGLYSFNFPVGSENLFFISARVSFWPFKVIQGH